MHIPEISEYSYLFNFFIVLIYFLFITIRKNHNPFKKNETTNKLRLFNILYALWGIANIFFYFLSYD